MRAFGGSPPPDTHVTVVSRTRYTPYSGMLPGLIAGHYRFDECHIGLDWLANKCGCELVKAEAALLRLNEREVVCRDGRHIGYDLLSIDIGSTPAMRDVPGARTHALPIKPIDRFLEGWARVETRIANGERLRLAVVGGGAGSVELALSLQHRLRLAHKGAEATRFALVTDQPRILTSHNGRVRAIFEDVLRARGVEMLCNHRVTRVKPGRLECADGSSVEADSIIWVTTPAPPEWISRSGLSTDARAFIAVNDCLQSVSHREIFAAGDIATMVDNTRPKSGVYAVRQGPPLARNLRRALEGRCLVEYSPQRRSLALISTGDRNAVASYGPLSASGKWVWRWKNWIDRAWMRRYLPPQR